MKIAFKMPKLCPVYHELNSFVVMANLIKLMSILPDVLGVLCSITHKYRVSEFFRKPGRSIRTIDSLCTRIIHLDSSYQPWNYSQDQTRELVFPNARSQSDGFQESVPPRVSKLAFKKQSKRVRSSGGGGADYDDTSE